MAKLKKAVTKKTVAKKTAAKKAVAKKAVAKKTAVKKTTARKTATPKVKSKKAAVAKIVPDNMPAISKGSKLACKVCGFAITVDHIGGYVEEAYLVCCETPMKHKGTTSKKK